MTTTSEQRALEPVNPGGFALTRMDPEVFTEVFRDNLGAGGLDAKDLDRIKIPAGGGLSWTVPSLDGETEEREVTGIVIHWADRRAYWPQKFSGEGVPPDCSSADCVTGVGNPGGACEVCPLAQFGSAKDEKGMPTKGQACKQMRQLFIAREGGGLLPVVLTLPPTSVAPIRKYFLRLASEQLACWSVVTKFTLTKTKNSTGINYSQATATLVRRLSPEEAKSVEQYRNQIRPALDRLTVTEADYHVVDGGSPE